MLIIFRSIWYTTAIAVRTYSFPNHNYRQRFDTSIVLYFRVVQYTTTSAYVYTSLTFDNKISKLVQVIKK